MFISKVLHFFKDLVRSNSGISVKSFIMLWGAGISTLVIVWYLTMKTIEMFTDYVLHNNWAEFTAVIGSLSVFILASVYGKVKGEQSYYGYRSYEQDYQEPKDDANINMEDGVG